VSTNHEVKAELLEVAWDHYGLDFPKRVGEAVTLCPVHEESHPSCSVDTLEGVWHCHACGAGGDVYTLIQLREGVNFTDASTIAEEILNRSGRALHESTGRVSSRRVSRRKGNRSSVGKYRPSWMDR
jgi:DNA primase